MTFVHPLPWWALSLVVAAALAVVVLTYRAGAAMRPRGQLVGLAVVRALVLLLLVAIWMRPVQLQAMPGATGRVLAVLVDVSRSMGLAAADGASRLDAALTVARDDLLPALTGEFDVVTFAFGEGARRVDLGIDRIEATDRHADLDRALADVVAGTGGRDLMGVIVVSDGSLDLPHPVGNALNSSAPVFAVAVGESAVARDREVVGLTIGEVAMTEATVDLTATLVARGGADGPAIVRVLQDDRPLEVREVVLPADGVPVREVFRVEPRRDAPSVIVVELAGDAPETTLDNNRRAVVAPPARRARRLLMIEGMPGHEHSFLKRALGDDPGLTVDAVIRKGRNQQGEETYYVQADGARAAALAEGFPATREALFVYDAVILANIAADELTREELEAIEAFVSRRGGGLLLLGARTLDPLSMVGTVLERLLPLSVSDAGRSFPARSAPGITEPLVPVLTPDGDDHPVMRLGPTADETSTAWAKVPPLAAVSPLGGPRGGAQVLATTTAAGGIVRPLVAWQQFGHGRTLVFTGEAAWRWRMRLPSNDQTYETFWRQVARFLAGPAPEPIAVGLTALSAHDVEVRIDARLPNFEPLTDHAVAAFLSLPSGDRRAIALLADDDASGAWTGRVTVETPGIVRVEAVVGGDDSVGGAEAWWLSGGFDREMADPRADATALARLAEARGGRLLDAGDTRALSAALQEAVSAPPTYVERDLWHRPWVWLLVAGLLCAEWTLRRRWGWR